MKEALVRLEHRSTWRRNGDAAVAKEYIEREALEDAFCNACHTHKRYHRTFEECRSKVDTDGNRCFKMRLIDGATPADVVEVVRCKDCKYIEMVIDLIGDYHCYCGNVDGKYITGVDFEDFCSHGERKEV